jgi:hypothetical protein
MPETTAISEEQVKELLKNPLLVSRELNNRSLYHFLQYFWPVYTTQKFSPNWHIEYICNELEKVAERVANRQPREYDLIINVPPGSTKTACVGQSGTGCVSSLHRIQISYHWRVPSIVVIF